MAATFDSRLVRRPSGGFSILGSPAHPGADALTPIRDAAYPGLSQARLGTAGAVFARGAPQVTRPHLEAALALWEYCHDSARELFARVTPEALPDRLLHALQQPDRGMIRWDIARSVGHNRAAAEVTAALQSLAAQGLAASRKEESGGGRPKERWYAVSRANTT